MNLITCTKDCYYQKDGCCTLEQAVTCSLPPASPGDCVNFVARGSDQSGKGFPDIPHAYEL